MTMPTEIDLGKGYKYHPAVGIFKDGELVIDEKTLIAITYWQDLVRGVRQGNGLWRSEDD